MKERKKEVKTRGISLKKIDRGDFIEVRKTKYRLPADYSGKTDANIKKEQNKQSALRRARRQIKRIIELNIDDKSCFITLTYEKTELDYDKSQYDFKKFIQRLKYNYGDFRYIAIREHQESRGKKEKNIGSIHYHIIIFGNSKIKKLNYSDINNIWSLGITNIKPINDFDGLDTDKIGNYFSKYFSKQEIAKGKKMYFTSRNIKREKIKKVNELRYITLKDYSNIEYFNGISKKLLISKENYKKYKENKEKGL